MIEGLRRWFGTAGAAALLAGCTPAGMLNALNSVTPGDGGVSRVAHGAAYGADPRQRLDAYAPDGAEGPLPVLIFFYGGAWVSGSRGEYGFAGKAYASHGFLTIVPDYRLVPDHRFPAFVEDGAGAIRWARDHARALGGDPERILLTGHSAGAYIAAMLALDTRYLREAGVDPAIVRAGALLSGPYDFFPWDSPRAVAAFGEWPKPRETQPIAFARPDAPPLWLATGSDDETVRPGNSERLAATLQAAGAEAQLRRFPGADHVAPVMSLSKPFRGRTPALAESAAFLHRHAR